FVHDECVVDRNADDLVDTIRVKRGCELVVAGHVRARARRRESPGQGEYDDVLALEDLVGRDVAPLAAYARAERDVRNSLAFVTLGHDVPPVDLTRTVVASAVARPILC